MIAEIYNHYQRRCKQSDAMDFDDLLLQTNILFRDFPEILDKYQNKFSYLLVDEYQDTNYSQYLIIKKLSEVHHNICVVGDDAQSIYSFRGARIENILNFRNDYPDYKIIQTGAELPFHDHDRRCRQQHHKQKQRTDPQTGLFRKRRRRKNQGTESPFGQRRGLPGHQ